MQLFKISFVFLLAAATLAVPLPDGNTGIVEARNDYDLAGDTYFNHNGIEAGGTDFDNLASRDSGIFARGKGSNPSFSPGAMDRVNADFKQKTQDRLMESLRNKPKFDPSAYKPQRPNEHSSKSYFSEADAKHYAGRL